MITTVISGKGGTGKTYFSTALALSLENSMYFDLDVEEPNGYVFLKPEITETKDFNVPVPEIDESACSFCGKCADSCVFNAISILPGPRKALFFPELCHSCGVCTHVCPVVNAITEVDRKIGVIRKGTFNGKTFVEGRLDIGEITGVPLIRNVLEKYTDGESEIIVDAPPGTSCPVVETVKKADFVIIVTEPTPFGLSDMKLVVEITAQMGKKTGVIINKDRGSSMETEEFLRKVSIPVIFRIPYSMEIQRAYSKGEPLTSTVPGIEKKLRKMYRETINGKA